MKSARLRPSPGLELRAALDWSNKACNPAFLDLARFLLLALALDFVSGGVLDKDSVAAFCILLVWRLDTGTGAGSLIWVRLLQCPQVMALVGPDWRGLERRLRASLPFERRVIRSGRTCKLLPWPRNMMWPQQLQTCCRCLSGCGSSCSNIRSVRRLMRCAEVSGAVVASRCPASVRNSSAAVKSLEAILSASVVKLSRVESACVENLFAG